MRATKKSLLGMLSAVSVFFLSGAFHTASAGTLLGVYNGNASSSVATIYSEMQSWQGKDNAVGTVYVDWCSRNIPYTWQMATDVWGYGDVPQVVWQPENTGCHKTTPANVDHEIATGQMDTYITDFFNNAKTFLAGPDGTYGTADDRRVYIRFAHECNGNWYPWSPAYSGSTDTPADYINMWAHVVSMARNMGLDSDHLQFIWNVNANDVGGYTAEQLFPGNTVLNWVSIDGYNWGYSTSYGTWQTASQVFSNMIARVQKLSTLPLGIEEVGCTTAYTATTTSVSEKAAWITDYFNYVAANNVKMTAWFNTDTSGSSSQDWAVFGGANGDEVYDGQKAYAEYRIAVGSSSVIGSDPTNPRLLTSAEFAGQI